MVGLGGVVGPLLELDGQVGHLSLEHGNLALQLRVVLASLLQLLPLLLEVGHLVLERGNVLARALPDDPLCFSVVGPLALQLGGREGADAPRARASFPASLGRHLLGRLGVGGRASGRAGRGRRPRVAHGNGQSGECVAGVAVADDVHNREG